MEFISLFYNVLLRRDRMCAAYLVVTKNSVLFAADVDNIADFTSHDFVSEVLASGDCSS